MNYFEGYTKENARKRYMDLVKLHHPDRGGDGETMRLINAQYQEVQSSGSVYFTNPSNGYDPYSKRRLTATPASRPTDFWNSADFAQAARNAAREAGRQYAQKQRQQQASAGTGSSREWWTTGERVSFASAARNLRRSGVNSTFWASDRESMEKLARQRILNILAAAGYQGWISDKIVNVELTDVGNKWATFTIHTNYADFEHRGLNNLAKIIRSSLKRFDETDTKFYRLKAEFGKLHGFQIKY